MSDLNTSMRDAADDVEQMLDKLLVLEGDPEDRVLEAMRYASLGGGKRVRPYLVLTSAAMFDVVRPAALRAAAALEMVHCYSLVHDDLPAMDNDDLRRGQPTCHIKFDEATAILAGDALLTRAFEVLSNPDTHDDPRVRADLVLALAQAAGEHGMVGGQMLDLLAETTTLSMPEITRMQRMKTGMLISVACEMGAILGHASEQAHRALRAYSHDLGLAFQIADDLLDLNATAEEMGKQTGKDADAGKSTFVSLMGEEKARNQAKILRDQAIEHLEMFGEKSDLLKQLATFVVDRRA
ncbi:MAG: polyprenyl synthetase family protein [Rhodospirillales bacterium]|jgi:farnesyl diphosphate synthase|nr:polyprenyl synthetase family protein [Rhodospirillales bacterium]MBT4041387.1 polyprenyl synthetase family protein [Rhodospirillales bacterium]MBT4628196.1 polyprenyl synthetase family protein [Rhodospirillales bacterium]MBT5519953.1 polyprenyl synthetase family protein [Rhodospirillales bacterium]MBT6108966.1 polyprenyl synthetase family protein [Rhodospirillales bacterium]